MDWCEHECLGVLVAHPRGEPCPDENGLKQWAQWFLGYVQYLRDNPLGPEHEWHGLWRQYAQEDKPKCLQSSG